MASSVSGQDELNRALWLATQVGKMKPSCPLGTTCCIPQAKFPLKPYKAKKKKHAFRPDFYKQGSGQAVILLFIISYCMLSLHIITFPQGYVGALRSNINKTKHQMLIKHKFV